ncbi:MAG: cardiolipin synthase [Treponema sp.]|nr:cardiolipin synthase [Treponema sp.]
MKSHHQTRRYKRHVKKGSVAVKKERPIRKRLLTYGLYGRFFTICFFIVLQFFLLIKLDAFLDSLLVNNFINWTTVVSVLFIIYLVNTDIKPEFKLAWMVPVTLFPLFGIILYLFFTINVGGIGLRKKLAKTTLTLKANLSPDAQAVGFTAYLQNSGGFPAYTNSQVAYFPSGEQAFKDMLVEVKKAKHFIFIEYFIIGLGCMWDTLLAILKEKAAQGVEIRVMYDGIGSIMLLPPGYPDYLESLGIQAKTYAPLVPLLSTHQNNRDHRKIFVIDGRVAYTGGINLSDEYINAKNRFGYWKDTCVRIDGSAVKNLTALFLQLWNVQKQSDRDWQPYIQASHISSSNREQLLKDKKQTAVSGIMSYFGGTIVPYGDDALSGESIAELVYCDMVNRAQRYVHITTPYIILNHMLATALIYAAKRGVEVSILVPSRADHKLTFCIGRTFIKDLIDNGVSVAEYVPGFIHAKMFVVDDVRAVVGSINLDYRSLCHHFECAVYIENSAVISDIERDFNRTRTECHEITSENYKKIPAYKRFAGRVARMFAPLL